MKAKLNNTGYQENLTKQVREINGTIEKYCPNCGMKHKVHSELVNQKPFGDLILYTITCPDESGTKIFGKYIAPFAIDVVKKSYFIYKPNDQIN